MILCEAASEEAPIELSNTLFEITNVCILHILVKTGSQGWLCSPHAITVGTHWVMGGMP